MCLSGATCPSAHCCFSGLAHYKNPTQRDVLEQSGSHHHLIENELVLAIKIVKLAQQSLTHSNFIVFNLTR